MNSKNLNGWTTVLLVAAVASLWSLAGCDRSGGASANVAEAGPAVTPAKNETPATNKPADSKAETVKDPQKPASEPREPEEQVGAVIDFKKRVHDFGEIWDVAEQTCSFEFTNTGTETLVIKDIKPSCGCTAVKLDQMTFAPGEGSAIEVSFKPKGFGKQTKSVDVITENSWPERIPKLKIVATIKPFVQVKPYTVRFGSVRLGETHRQILEINSADKTMEITNIEATARSGSRVGEFLSAEVIDPAEDNGEYGGGKEPPLHRIAVTLDDTAPWGQVYGTLKIHARGRPSPDAEPVEHVKSVSINAKVFGRITSDESMFRVGTLKPGASFSKEIKLTSPSGDPFAVLGVELLDSRMPEGQIRVHVVPVDGAAEGTGYRIVLSGEAREYTGSVSGKVRVTTDAPGEEELIFSLGGIVRTTQPKR
ncbi:MAG: DUF1573 domain-containing protein [Planctomycetes bacterium]|nr:DUF1573 domain-containing protein [Planctomycetota bacterium]